MSRRLKRRKITRPERKFYVDATGGSDANDGRGPTGPWQTIGKVNGYTFEAEDEILFKRGETWVGTSLAVPRSNLLFGAYGAGAKPIVDGNVVVAYGIVISGKDNITVENIAVTGGTSGGIMVQNASTHIKILECNAYSNANDGLLFFSGSNNCLVYGGKYYSQTDPGGVRVSGIEVGDNCHDIDINGAECYGNLGSGCGIAIIDHWAVTFPYNITVRNCILRDNAEHGMLIGKVDQFEDTDRNILIENCNAYGNTLHGYMVDKHALRVFYVDGVTFRDCNSYDNLQRGWYIEGDNIYLERCLVHNSWNILVEDCENLVLNNCTIYTAVYTGFNRRLLNIIGARTDGVTARNCIMASDDAACPVVGVEAGATTNIDIDYTLYGQDPLLARWHWNGVDNTWANWLINSSQDANSLVPADPLFVNPGADDFALQAGSPAIDAGVDVGLPYLGTAPDCGAYERE